MSQNRQLTLTTEHLKPLRKHYYQGKTIIFNAIADGQEFEVWLTDGEVTGIYRITGEEYTRARVVFDSAETRPLPIIDPALVALAIAEQARVNAT